MVFHPSLLHSSRVSGFKNVRAETSRSPENNCQKPHVATSVERMGKLPLLLNGSSTKDFVAIFNLTQYFDNPVILQIIKPKSCIVICYLAPFIYWPALWFPYLYDSEDWWSNKSFLCDWQLIFVTELWTAMKEMLSTSTVNGQ